MFPSAPAPPLRGPVHSPGRQRVASREVAWLSVWLSLAKVPTPQPPWDGKLYRLMVYAARSASCQRYSAGVTSESGFRFRKSSQPATSTTSTAMAINFTLVGFILFYGDRKSVV